MRMLTVLTLAITLTFISQAVAAQDDARQALAEELLNEMNMKATVEKSFEMIKKTMLGQMSKIKPPTAQAKADPKATEAMEKTRDRMVEKMMDMVSKEVSWDRMKEDYVKIYADTFTEEELQGLITFYKTPVGKAFIEKQPIIIEQSMKLSQQRLMQIMPKIQTMTQEMAKEIAQEKIKQMNPAAKAGEEKEQPKDEK